MIHELKCWPENLTRILYDDKTAEFRKNDRKFRLRDFLYLREWEPKRKKYTGVEVMAQIRSIDYGPAHGIPQDYVMLSIHLLGTCG